jgi:hypothetical protein
MISIPENYREEFLEALRHYPELSGVKISVVKKKYHPVPYGATPDLANFFRKKHRSYTITIREKAEGPLKKALFRNLPRDAKIGIAGHELAHVLQYERMGRIALLAMALGYLTSPLKRRDIEREADLETIQHGLGHQLYAQTMYLRGIPGYLKKRPGLDVYYLKPHEILQAIAQLETGIGV